MQMSGHHSNSINVKKDILVVEICHQQSSKDPVNHEWSLEIIGQLNTAMSSSSSSSSSGGSGSSSSLGGGGGGGGGDGGVAGGGLTLKPSF